MRILYRYIVFFLFSFYVFCNESYAQKAKSDTTIKAKISIPKDNKPKRAALLSAVVPGLGQIYNRSYWKVPLVYLGLGTSYYFINLNYKEIKLINTEIEKRLNNEPEETWNSRYIAYSDASQLDIVSQDYRRRLELGAILGVVFYSFQVVDALVDAHLKNFDVSDNLSIQIKPSIIPYKTNNFASGVAINLKLK
jgi:hypothetical protein